MEIIGEFKLSKTSTNSDDSTQMAKCFHDIFINHLAYNVLFAISLFTHLSGTAQDITAKEGSFGVDHTHRIIVWHHENLDSLQQVNREIKDFNFGRKFSLVGTGQQLSYLNSLQLEENNTIYTLYITKMPIVHIDVKDEIKDDVKRLGHFTYFFDNNFIQNPIGIEHRGNLSLTFPKKSYDLEFWTDSIHKMSKDVKFQGLKRDDDWILDGLYNEPLRLRSYMASKLWKAIHAPYYQTTESKARSGADLRYVELFKNGSYQGVYGLSESIARSLLELKKNEQQQIHGELFKASSYEGAPSFLKAPKYDDTFPHWGGFEMKYPIVDYKSHWKNLSQFVNLVVHSNDAEFSRKIDSSVHIDNVIDYYLFVNLLRATDNLGKNYYLARYDENNPYFFVPWDLDGVMGIIQDGKRIPTTDDLLSNGLFDRLLKINPDGFIKKLKDRWAFLRKNEYSDTGLTSKMEKIYSGMKSEKQYERERIIWPSEKTEEEHYEYLVSWLKKRLAFLDTHFTYNSSTSEGVSNR